METQFDKSISLPFETINNNNIIEHTSSNLYNLIVDQLLGLKTMKSASSRYRTHKTIPAKF